MQALLLLACNGGPQSNPYGAIVALSVEPASVELTTTSTEQETVDYVAIAEFESGHVEELSGVVGWSLSNESVGIILQDGHFTTSAEAGGRTLVQANAGGILATADVIVVFTESVIDGGASEVDLDEDAPVDGALRWLYPEDGAALPLNVPSMTFMWDDAWGADLYRLRFRSATTEVEVWTTSNEYEVVQDIWRVITATNAGGEVEVRLDAVKLVDGEVADQVTAEDMSFLVNRFDAFGAITYFATNKQGIIRSPVDQVAPVEWFSRETENTNSYCVGCHVVSPDGERLGYSWQVNTDADEQVGLASITEDIEPEPLIPMDSSADYGSFATFSSDGDYIVFSEDNELHFYDGRTGDYASTLDSDLYLTMPHWSADDSMLVAVSGMGNNDNTRFARSALVIFDHLGDGVFGPPRTLLPEATDYNYYYPMFSPDSQWVAYNRSSTGRTAFTEDAALWLVAADGTGEEIELVTANRSDVGNASWPRWGPIPDDDILWLAFASNRPYGHYQPEDSQIWITGIDTTVAETGEDPSLPAYRLPQQSLETSNHAPFWSMY
ncbi:MAG TPA: hypothetical protein QGF58_09250 [Myxococcota bacterium]|nr:hypothetical protein [Myxococcota bacterium]